MRNKRNKLYFAALAGVLWSLPGCEGCPKSIVEPEAPTSAAPAVTGPAQIELSPLQICRRDCRAEYRSCGGMARAKQGACMDQVFSSCRTACDCVLGDIQKSTSKVDPNTCKMACSRCTDEKFKVCRQELSKDTDSCIGEDQACTNKCSELEATE